VTLGTALNGHRRVFQAIARALAELDVQVVVTVGRFNDPSLLEPVPPNFIVEQFIPHCRLLPRVDLVVCHGGFLTTIEALAHGVPLVCLPIWADNPEVAQRVKEFGAGLRLNNLLEGNRINYELLTSQLREAVRTALADPGYKANAGGLQRAFRKEDGPAEAASLLLRLAETRQPVLRSRTYWESKASYAS
jgi:MGT family glycosyltransferase